MRRAGVLGFAGGQSVTKIREHPETVVPILQVSAASGTVCKELCNVLHAQTHIHTHTFTVRVVLSCSLAGVLGAVVGWGVAAYRNLPSHVYSLSLAANFAVVSGAFLGTVYSDGRL